MGCKALWHKLIHIKASNGIQKISSSPAYLFEGCFVAPYVTLLSEDFSPKTPFFSLETTDYVPFLSPFYLH